MLGCFVATVGSFILGAIWYDHRFPSGSVWMRRTYPGKTADEIGQGLKPYMGISVVTSFMLSLLLRFILVDFFHVKSILDAVKFTVGLCCLTTLVEIPHRLFSANSIDVFIIDQLFNFMSLTLGAVCIAYFN